MKKENEYIKNTIILLIGKFSSQIIAFLLLPLYTYKLKTSDYGYIDLIQTYISLLAPILLLQLDSAVFRYLIEHRENNEEKKSIITNSSLFLLLVIVLIPIIASIIHKFIVINYYIYIIINLIMLIVNNYVLSITRGFGDNKTYSKSSVLSCIIMFITNFILIVGCELDARSILIGSILSNFLTSIYLCIKEKIYKYISIKKINKQTLKKLFKYSIPMIPSVISWWIVGLSDRTMIAYYISTAANGIYSVSCKFSNLINSVFSIFNMSWQETASIHINDSDACVFFSKIMTNIYKIFVILSCGIIGLLPIFFEIIIGTEYTDAYQYIPILVFANICYVADGLLGGIYVAKKMTKKVAITTVYSAIINIAINLLLIAKMKLYAACISTVIAYLIILVYRYIDVRKIIKIKFNIKTLVVYIIGYIVLLLPYYLRYRWLSLFLLLVELLFYFYDNKKVIFDYWCKIRNKIIKC